MNTHQDELARALGRDLHAHADGLHGAPISLEDVKGTAAGIRRRRAFATTAGAAAAVAVVVPTLMLGLSGAPETQDPLPVDTPQPTPTGTVEGSLDIDDLPRGAEPGIPWVASGTLHHDGREIPLPDGVDHVAVLGDEYVVATRTSVVVIDSTGREIATEPSAEFTGLAVNATGTAVAWMDPDNAPVIWQAGFPEALHYDGFTGPGGNPQAVGLIGEDCTADVEAREGPGCSVVFTIESDRGEVQSYVSPSHGLVGIASTTLEVITAVSATGRHAGITEITDDGTCSAVTAPQADYATWSTCDHRLRAFSPDGSLVTGPQAYGSGIGDGEVAILSSADGDVLVSLDNRESQSFVAATAWEDDGHVLAEVFQAGQWAIVRIGLDGGMEYAVGPVPGEDLENPFRLAVGP